MFSTPQSRSIPPTSPRGFGKRRRRFQCGRVRKEGSGPNLALSPPCSFALAVRLLILPVYFSLENLETRDYLVEALRLNVEHPVLNHLSKVRTECIEQRSFWD